MLDSIKNKLRSENAEYEQAHKKLTANLGNVLQELLNIFVIVVDSNLSSKGSAMSEISGYYKVLHSIYEDIIEEL